MEQGRRGTTSTLDVRPTSPTVFVSTKESKWSEAIAIGIPSLATNGTQKFGTASLLRLHPWFSCHGLFWDTAITSVEIGFADASFAEDMGEEDLEMQHYALKAKKPADNHTDEGSVGFWKEQHSMSKKRLMLCNVRRTKRLIGKVAACLEQSEKLKKGVLRHKSRFMQAYRH